MQHNNTLHCNSVPARDTRKPGARPNQHLFVNSRNASNIWGQFPDRVMMAEGSGNAVCWGMMDLMFGSIHIWAHISLHFKWLSFMLFQQEWQKLYGWIKQTALHQSSIWRLSSFFLSLFGTEFCIKPEVKIQALQLWCTHLTSMHCNYYIFRSFLGIKRIVFLVPYFLACPSAFFTVFVLQIYQVFLQVPPTHCTANYFFQAVLCLCYICITRGYSPMPALALISLVSFLVFGCVFFCCCCWFF